MCFLLNMWFKWLIVLLSCAKLGSSIRCYDCTSVNNSMCLDPHLYDQETLDNFLRVTECHRGLISAQDTGEFFCRKIKQTILKKHYEPEVRIMRGCGWKRDYRPCYKADNEDHQEMVCQCFGDMCNGSEGKYVSLVVLFVGITLGLMSAAVV